MEKIIIEPINPKKIKDDIEMLCRLEREIFGIDGYPRYFFRQSAELFSDTFLVCRDEKRRIIGYLLGAMKGREAWMLSMCVDEKLRRQGIGSALLKDFMERVREKADAIYITVDPKNHDVINMYSGHGFRIQKMLQDYHGAGYHRYLMKKTMKKQDAPTSPTG